MRESWESGRGMKDIKFFNDIFVLFKQNNNKSEPKNFDFSLFSLELYFIVSHESHRIEAF